MNEVKKMGAKTLPIGIGGLSQNWIIHLSENMPGNWNVYTNQPLRLETHACFQL